jgi:pimeloyl-ACP methyl ester carboxylesterase
MTGGLPNGQDIRRVPSAGPSSSPPRLDPEDLFFDVEGIRHHVARYRDAAAGPAVLCVHGQSQQARVFDAFAWQLARRGPVFSVDIRGRGDTGWGPPEEYQYDVYERDLEAVRDRLGLETMRLVGTSMGGYIALLYASCYGERVDRLVLNDVGPEFADAGYQRIRAYFSQVPDSFAAFDEASAYMRQTYAPVLAGRTQAEVDEYTRWHMRQTSDGRYGWKMDPAVRTGPARVVPDAWERFAAIRCPTLAIRGEHSDILSPDILNRMMEVQPTMEVVVVPGVGHAPLLDEPGVGAAVAAFFGNSQG